MTDEQFQNIDWKLKDVFIMHRQGYTTVVNLRNVKSIVVKPSQSKDKEMTLKTDDWHWTHLYEVTDEDVKKVFEAFEKSLLS